jgi:hypothetical protein
MIMMSFGPTFLEQESQDRLDLQDPLGHLEVLDLLARLVILDHRAQQGPLAQMAFKVHRAMTELPDLKAHKVIRGHPVQTVPTANKECRASLGRQSTSAVQLIQHQICLWVLQKQMRGKAG